MGKHDPYSNVVLDQWPHPPEIDWFQWVGWGFNGLTGSDFQLQVRLDGVLKLVLDEVRIWCGKCTWVVQNRICSVQNKSKESLQSLQSLRISSISSISPCCALDFDMCRLIACWIWGSNRRSARSLPRWSEHCVISKGPVPVALMRFNEFQWCILVSFQDLRSAESDCTILYHSHPFTPGFSFRGSATRFSLQQRGQRRC